MKFKAAVFDFDGILAETEEVHMMAWVEVARRRGFVLSKEEYLSRCSGWSSDDIAKRLRETHKEILLTDGKEKDRIVAEMFASQPMEALPFAKEAVMFFKKNGARVAVATGGDLSETRDKLEKIGMDKMFDAISTRDLVKKGKPAPDIYLKAAELLKVRPQDCVTFDDTGPWTLASKNAGMTSVAVPSLFTGSHDFSHADKVFKNLKEAIDWVKKQ